MTPARDAFGEPFALPAPPARVVSLVPSDTFSVFALGAGARLVGRTDYCVQPAGEVDRVPTVGGTKTPRVEDVLALRPDLVLANREENKERHVRALREGGARVFVSEPRTVAEGASHLRALGALLDAPAQDLADRAQLASWEGPRPRVLYLIWARPWMGIAPGTYAFDALREAGMEPFAPEGATRYPRLTDEDIAASGVDAVLFPTEPYAFGPADVDGFAQAFPDLPAVRRGRLPIVPGEHATWHGAWAADGLPALRALAQALA